MEDVDAAFNKRVQTSEDGYVTNTFIGLSWDGRGLNFSFLRCTRYQSSVTFSGFLNALDGVASGEERIIFLTTNHLDKLDPALIRPGRVDLACLIDDASPSQAKRLFIRFYDSEQNLDLEKLGDELGSMVDREMTEGRRVSMAALQGSFIRNGPEGAVRAAKELFVER